MSRLFLLLSLVVLVPQYAAAQSPDDVLAQMQNVRVIELGERDIESWIAVANEFEAKSIEIDNPLEGSDEPARQSMLASLASNREAMAILEKHGFSPERFSDVSLNIVLALGASEIDKHSDEIATALAELEAMKDELPPAQYEMLHSQVAGARSMFSRAPEGNIELVRKYEKELAAID